MSSYFATKIEVLSVGLIKPAKKNARTHSKKQIAQLARAIERYGFTVPIIVDEHDVIVAGHGRLAAAKSLDMKEIPCIRHGDLTDEEKRAYALSENKLPLGASWDLEVLSDDFRELLGTGFTIEDTGFELYEVDQILVDESEASPKPSGPEDDHRPPPAPEDAVCRLGDTWEMGGHRLVVGDAKDLQVVQGLMAGDVAHMCFADPPYNQKIQANVAGHGAIKFREFSEASGEMSRDEFVTFLKDAIGPATTVCKDGAIMFLCMDDKHLAELFAAGDACGLRRMRVCVWAKSNGGLGTFYRSQTEFVTVWKVGTAPHTNTFGLGDTGRSRTTLWKYPGVNAFGASRMQDLAAHPTVKNTAMVADAIRDVSNRGEIVLDMFAGSGTTLIAAHKTGRYARLIEIDSAYGDVIIARWEKLTGKRAVLATSGEDFESVGIRRRAEKTAWGEPPPAAADKESRDERK